MIVAVEDRQKKVNGTRKEESNEPMEKERIIEALDVFYGAILAVGNGQEWKIDPWVQKRVWRFLSEKYYRRGLEFIGKRQFLQRDEEILLKRSLDVALEIIYSLVKDSSITEIRGERREIWNFLKKKEKMQSIKKREIKIDSSKERKRLESLLWKFVRMVKSRLFASIELMGYGISYKWCKLNGDAGMALLEEANQEAMFWVDRAIEKFEPSTGNRLSTYAHLWIRQGVVRMIRSRIGPIRIPYNIWEIVRKTENGMKKMGLYKLTKENIEKVASYVGKAPEKIREAVDTVKLAAGDSLDRPAGNGESHTNLIEFVANLEKPERKEMLEEEEKIQGVLAAIEPKAGILDPLEAGVIRMVYLDRNVGSIAACAKEIGLSKHKVGSIAKRAIKKLRERHNEVEIDFIESFIDPEVPEVVTVGDKESTVVPCNKIVERTGGREAIGIEVDKRGQFLFDFGKFEDLGLRKTRKRSRRVRSKGNAGEYTQLVLEIQIA